jgi:hypothetical protein
MTIDRTSSRVPRRYFLQAAAAASAGVGLSPSGLGQVCLPEAGTVRDRLWVFCNPRNADYGVVRKRSVMSPLEGAVYFGVPNILMVNQYPEGRAESLPGQAGWFEPFEPPFEQYALALNVLKRVAWSIVGAGGVTKDWERKQVLDMALRTPNFVGVYMDDFFRSKPTQAVASLTLGELRAIQRQLKGSPKKLDLFVTFYTQFLNRPISEYLNLIDVIVMWTGHVKDLANLKANLALLAKLAPKSRKMLGLYTADYHEKRVPAWTGMPISAMQHQCEVALRCLREDQIEGIVIYGCTTEDLGWESVEWTRDWIQRIGDTKL